MTFGVFASQAASVWIIECGFLIAAELVYRMNAMNARLWNANAIVWLTASGAGAAYFAGHLASGKISSIFVVLVACICVSVVTDMATGHILDVITVPSLAWALLLTSVHGADARGPLVGTVAVGGSILLLYLGSRGRAIGLGDVKLATCIGALLGYREGLHALAFTFGIGGSVAAVLLRAKAPRPRAIPLAPFMAAGVFADFFLRLSNL